MKKYFCGAVEVKNIELIKNTLSEYNDKKHCIFIGVQRSLARLYKINNDNIEKVLFSGTCKHEEIENISTNTYENCKFELPLFTNWNNCIAVATIEGTGREIVETGKNRSAIDKKLYFDIENLSIEFK